MSTRTLTLARSTYPVTLPSIRDSRLHVASVVITIHVLGQVALGFQVSVPQIVSAILTCALLEVAITFRAKRAFVWPASAMLTGSGVALIMRVPTTTLHDHWTFHRWYVFAGVAGASLLTKYVLRYRGAHVFNPSNIGLVVAFVVFGSTRLEPLDFWWGPLDVPMVMAYGVILTGGLLITARLRLLSVVVAFYGTLAAGIGLLAASGHCMVARWAFAPVCGFDYWNSIVTSPELLIFLFFMITDPKTVPTSRNGRVMFGVLVAVACTLLMAPQQTEFGTKVALLGGLAVVCAGRPIVDRLMRTSTREASPRRGMAVLTAGRRRVRVGLCTGLAVVVGVAIVAAGAPARGVVVATDAELLGRVPHDVDASTFPAITVQQDVLDWNHEITGSGAQEIVLVLAENLQLENQALRRGDESILEAVDHGDRLDQMRERLRQSVASGVTVVQQYQIDEVHVTLLIPFGRQDGLSLGLESRGTVTAQTYDASGNVQSRVSSAFATTFVVRRATGARWLTVAELPLGAAG
jgi:Na+-translocating ferredoxin:NAD+ oxidoreductase RnfD subunit